MKVGDQPVFFPRCTPNVHRRWEDETARENAGHPPSYAEVNKMKSLVFRTH